MTDELTRTSGDAHSPPPPLGGGRFVAGTVLAGRYRIVHLLGAGGMGEVYKADDLKLDHPVALKFLPETLALSPAALARFHGEVRIARRVSHPNVCRVHDIGDVDGLHFLTMELIDGEDLASLLRRIGRLPADKAVEVSRQLCAGLAAAHDAGVLHRDLKPHNVMIDGRGRARITDFGIAALAREVRKDNVVAGTPAYMAPEQVRGAETAVRSDIYSLGLILYEIFTGKRAIQASSLADAVMHHSSASATAVATPSSVVPDISPAVERVILRCLEKNPAARPASAIQVSAALPGGDPLQAALAAGETPSPEMVAASGSNDAMRPAIALGIAIATIAAAAFVGFAGARDSLQGRVLTDTSRDVLAFRARETLTALGYPDRGADNASGFVRDAAYLEWDRENRPTEGRIERLAQRPAGFQFWYRESPRPMGVHLGIELGGAPRFPELTLDNPPADRRGMRHLTLDAKGRLIEFGAVPLEDERGSRPAGSTNWNLVFQLAGLDSKAFTPVTPEWTPPVAMDERAAWSGTYPEQPDLPIRLEAAAYHGKLVAFQTMGAWSATPAPRMPVAANVGTLLVALSALILALVNTRAGRVDRRGAWRLATLIFSLALGVWALGRRHVAAAAEMEQFRMAVSLALFNGALAFVSYVAIEPHVRRRWPAVLIGWSRLMAGQWRDPLVGREALAGSVLAIVAALCTYISRRLYARAMDVDQFLNTFASLPAIAGGLLGALQIAIGVGLLMTVFVLVMRVLTRSTIAAGAIAVVLAGAAAGSLFGSGAAFSGAITALARMVALAWFGLVGLVAAILTTTLTDLLRTGLAQDAGTGVFVLVVLAAFIGAAAYIAVGRPAVKATAP